MLVIVSAYRMYMNDEERETDHTDFEGDERERVVTIGERRGRYVGFYVASMHFPSPLYLVVLLLIIILSLI